MSFFGASSSVGGGGFRFTAPTQTSSATSSIVTLSTAAGSPPVTIQVILRSSRPKLQMLASQINSCKAKAATVVKGTASQKQFNAQYCSLVSLLATVVKDVDDELFLAVEAQTKGSTTGAARLDPKKVPTTVTFHMLVKDLGIFITSAKEVSIGYAYLELVAKSAVASVVEKEMAQERNEAKNMSAALAAAASTKAGGKESAKAKAERKIAEATAALTQQQQQHINSSSNNNGNTAAHMKGKHLSPALLPHSLVVGGLPSPLQRSIGQGRGSGAIDDTTGARPSTAIAPPPQLPQDNPALSLLLQPWLIPYPFSHGTRTERVQAIKVAVAKAQRAGYAMQALQAKDPATLASVVEHIPGASHQKGSPVLGPGGAAVPPEVLLQYVLAHSGYTKAQYYSLAPRLLEICACQTASEMLTLWEQREGVFEVLLGALSSGASTLGQVSSINANANPQEPAPANAAAAAPATASGNSSSTTAAAAGAHVALAMRSQQLSSTDNTQLYLGSPTLRPFHTPPMRPMVSSGADMAQQQQQQHSGGGPMTPLILGGNDPYFIDDLNGFSLDDGFAGTHGSADDASLGGYGYGSTAVGMGGMGMGMGRTSSGKAVTEVAPRFFPHRCSNPALRPPAALNKDKASGAALSAMGQGRPLKGKPTGGSGFTVTNTTTNNRLSGGPIALAYEVPTSASAAQFFRSSVSPPMVGQKRGREEELPYSADGRQTPPLLSSPQPLRPLRGSGTVVPGIRTSAGVTSPPAQPLPPTDAVAPPADALEPQAFMSVSSRVMTCLLHFGVVVTELPMVIGAPEKEKPKREKEHHKQKHQV